MANTDAPMGLIPIKHASGAPYNGSCNAYYAPSDYAVALFVGDPVVRVADGSNEAAVSLGGAKFQPGTLPEINVGAAGGPFTGVVVGFGANPNALDKTYRPASTEQVVWVADDPDLVFEIQEVSGGTALTSEEVGLNANIVAGSGSTVTGYSGFELDNSTENTTAGLELKITRLANREDNAIGEHAKWEVRINDHTEAHAAAGI